MISVPIPLRLLALNAKKRQIKLALFENKRHSPKSNEREVTESMIFDIERHAATKLKKNRPAPGKPGLDARWMTGAKVAVGTALSAESRIWFTISDGILNEIYFPSIDQANTRKLWFAVTDGHSFASDEGSDTKHEVRWLSTGVPGFHIRNRCKQGVYEIEKEIVTDPTRDVLLMDVEFKPADNRNLRLYLLLNPHIGDCGADNDGWIGVYKDIPMLFALRGSTALALVSTASSGNMSCGFIGNSDPWTDISRHKRMTWSYTEALGGNIGLAAEIDWAPTGGRFTIALGCGGHAAEAAHQARAGLLQNFRDVRLQYEDQWQNAQRTYLELGGSNQTTRDLYRVSAAMLQVHESKRFPGGIIASLSIPWGGARGDEAVGGYHVLWPRDMVQAALGKLACGDAASARQTLFYLETTQESDGNWPQNMWLDGTPHWNAAQMDSTSFTVILADALRRANSLNGMDPWNMVRKAAEYLVRNGPLTQQDRWEENAGYSPYTMAVEIAALLAAADFADEKGQIQQATFLRETADAWNEAIDEFTYAVRTELSRDLKVDGYYIRIAPPEVVRNGLTNETRIRIKNLLDDRAIRRAVEIVSPDTYALVRFGLRSASDPRIVNTVKVIDATLKKIVSTGPVWHRYTLDGYGEKPDGSAFDKTGVGRGWPLLAGERAHYEVARGNFEAAKSLLGIIEKQTSECGLLPEQIWDSDDIPSQDLSNGHPSGSSMPLVWAHAEHIKLLRSIHEERVWDLPPQAAKRYQQQKTAATFAIWTFTQQRKFIPRGRNLRVDCHAGGKVRWTSDAWKTNEDIETTDSGLGVHYVVLHTANLPSGAAVEFTFFWPQVNQWEGRNFRSIVRNQ